MKLDLTDIERITFGAVRVKEEADGFHFYRFTEEETDLYEKRSPDFYAKSFATSGIQLFFKTNAHHLAVKGHTRRGSSRYYYAFDIFVNGERTTSCRNFRDDECEDYPKRQYPHEGFSFELALSGKGDTVKIVFPWSANAIIEEIIVDDGASLEREHYERKILFFGDSITQGYDALSPSSKYASRLAAHLCAEEYNKAIGGERFFPALAAAKPTISPDVIVVAYGTNDWRKGQRAEAEENAAAFFAALTSNYRGIPVFALTPVFRCDYADQGAFGPFPEIAEVIRTAAAPHPTVTVIDGYDFIPHEAQYFGDKYLHPNDQGFLFYFDALKEIIR